jgi:hypothetical protein
MMHSPLCVGRRDIQQNDIQRNDTQHNDHSVYKTMEQRTLKNVNNCLYTNIYSYLETSGGISYSSYLNVVHFFNTRVN